jgi:class 3 adenylate cyclase/tetratricopeptide (TPR) repeat protein
VRCPSCDRELPGTFPFCPFCGSAVADAPLRPRREERKVISVLFADLAGFTARAERLDPEDVRALLAPYHDRLRSELERFGGTVEKFIGDAVMALFGAPIAHEDDAERAVRAALAIRAWAGDQGERLRVRIGINSGEALVAIGARPSEGEAMAAGDVVNTAARLQVAAPVNGILVGELTYRATAQAIDYRAAAPVTAKGKREPIRAWEAVDARSRLGVDVSQRALAPLVGRVRDLELLVSTLARVREERSPQLITIVGVPGIGKSRLVFELLRVVEADAALVSWRQGRSLPYGEGVTFWALAEIVKAQAGILESDSPAEAEEKLGRAVGAVAADAIEAQWLERHLRPLAGLTERDPAGPEEGFAAWCRFLEALAEQRPIVLVFEDLHWADDALLDFVDQLVERASAVPLLVIGTARPELLQRRPAWGGGKPNAFTVSLPPLSDEETARLVRALLERPLLEAGTQEALLARAGGNPLYAEQYARVLLERGDVLDVPATVQGIVAARLDMLSAEEKGLLQDAAVVGKVFWLGAIEAIDGVTRRQAEELLHALDRKEFVQRSRASSIGGESEYAFRHLLIRDIAYGQIPRAARSLKHRLAATWIESLGRPDDQAEMLAHHYLQALELARAAGLDATALIEPTRLALREAGDRAAALYAVDAAERFYDAALRLWPEDGDPERAELLFHRAMPLGRHVAGGDPERLALARDALIAAGDNTRAAEAEMSIAQRFWIQGGRETAEEHRRRAAALIGVGAPTRSTAWVLMRLATRASLEGDSATAIELASRARAVSEELGWAEGLSDALGMLGVMRVYVGDRSGVEDIERSIELGAASGVVGVLSRAYNSMAVAHQVLGELELGYEARLEGAAAAERIGSESLLRWFQAALIDHQYRRGDWDEASGSADDFVASVEAGSPNVAAWQPFAVRGLMRLAKDDATHALADAEAALAAGRATGEVQSLNFVLAAGAHLFSTAGLRERAVALARELIESLAGGIEMQFAVINLPMFASAAVRLGLGDTLLDALGAHPATRWSEATRAYVAGDFVTAAEMLARIGARPDEAEARFRAGEQLAAEGRMAEAHEQLRQALEFYRSVGATRYVRAGEALLAAST